MAVQPISGYQTFFRNAAAASWGSVGFSVLQVIAAPVIGLLTKINAGESALCERLFFTMRNTPNLFEAASEAANILSEEIGNAFTWVPPARVTIPFVLPLTLTMITGALMVRDIFANYLHMGMVAPNEQAFNAAVPLILREIPLAILKREYEEIAGAFVRISEDIGLPAVAEMLGANLQAAKNGMLAGFFAELGTIAVVDSFSPLYWGPVSIATAAIAAGTFALMTR